MADVTRIDRWVHPVDLIKPSRVRERQIRKDAFQGRLAAFIHREHRILPSGYHQLDDVDLKGFVASCGQIKATDLDLLIDELPVVLIQSIEAIAVCSPFDETLGPKFVEAFNGRPEREERKPVIFLPLWSRGAFGLPKETGSVEKAMNRNVLIFNPWRDAGFIEQVVAGVGAIANPLAALVFIDCCAKPLDRQFPVYAMLRRPIVSKPKSQCVICRQVAAGRSNPFTKF